MSDLPPTWRFLAGTSRSRGSPENVSAPREEEMSISDYPESAHLASTSNATEPSELSEIFRVLSDIRIQEPSPPLTNNAINELPTTQSNLGAVEHGEPSTSTRKRKAEESELQKIPSEGNEQLSIEFKREEKKARKTRSTETHNLSERKRRGRINEKIKSLQELIPNSNKKDCASILDEAVQYLTALKDHAAQIQMMSAGMGSIYYNPYMSATGIPQMAVTQYSPYGPFRLGMRLVPLAPMPSMVSPSGILPQVQGPMELCPSLSISGTSSLPALQPSAMSMSTLPFDDQTKEGPPFTIIKKDARSSHEASAPVSAQIFLKPGPSSIVHATHIVPPATEEPNTKP